MQAGFDIKILRTLDTKTETTKTEVNTFNKQTKIKKSSELCVGCFVDNRGPKLKTAPQTLFKKYIIIFRGLW
jgi:hypothetical protein